MNWFRVFFLILLCPLIFGCEKTTIPFSANPIQPTTGKIDALVNDGSNPIGNIIVKVTDPNGNVLTTISDSTGHAIFNPSPFTYGDWIIELPNQSNRCFTSISTLNLTAVNNSKTVTFQYGVPVNLTVGSPTITPLGGALEISYTFTLITRNDCGTTWNVSLGFSGSNFQWSMGGIGALSPGQTHSINLISGQSFGITIVEYPGVTFSGPSVNISSIIGQTSSTSTTF